MKDLSGLSRRLSLRNRTRTHRRKPVGVSREKERSECCDVVSPNVVSGPSTLANGMFHGRLLRFSLDCVPLLISLAHTGWWLMAESGLSRWPAFLPHNGTHT